jgi:hypothetical protein
MLRFVAMSIRKECRHYRCYEYGRQVEIGGSSMKFVTTYQTARCHKPKTAVRIWTVSAVSDLTARVSVCNRQVLLAGTRIAVELCFMWRHSDTVSVTARSLPLVAVTGVELGTSENHRRLNFSRNYFKRSVFICKKIAFKRSKSASSNRCLIESAHCISLHHRTCS